MIVSSCLCALSFQLSAKSMYKLVVFPNDPIYKYYQKGEIKPRYYNSGNLFGEVHLISLCKQDIEAERVQTLVGDARLMIHSIGRPSPLSFPFYFSRALSLVTQIRPHVIRGHGIWQAGSLATYVGKSLNIPTIVSLHNDHNELRKYDKAFKYKLVKILEWYTLHYTDCAICVSKHVERFARRYGAKKQRSFITRYMLTSSCKKPKKVKMNGLPSFQ